MERGGERLWRCYKYTRKYSFSGVYRLIRIWGDISDSILEKCEIPPHVNETINIKLINPLSAYFLMIC